LLGAILGEDLLRDERDPELVFLDSLFSLDGWEGVGASKYCNCSRTFFRISSLLIDGTGLSEFVGVCVLDAFLEDFLVSGDASILCFHSRSLFIDSSLPTCSAFLLLSSDSSFNVLFR